MCNFHKEGMCRLGSKCMFAHSRAELREPFIPNGFCIAFITKGVCKWGSSCNYIHEVPSASKKHCQASEKLKLIKSLETPAHPRIPVGLNYVAPAPASKSVAGVVSSAPASKSGVVASAPITTPSVLSPVVGAAGSAAGKRGSSPVAGTVENSSEENGAKCKNKSKKEKESEEWSTVSRGAKPTRYTLELRSPSAIVAAFQLDSLCVLCREQVSQSNNRITLECGHSQFHRGCIKDWLRAATPALCPVCKCVSSVTGLDEAAPGDAASSSSSSSKKKK